MTHKLRLAACPSRHRAIVRKQPPSQASGALGCFASHVAAWRAVAKSGAARALVFEEDALLTAEGVATAASLAAALPSGSTGAGFDVALLGT